MRTLLNRVWSLVIITKAIYFWAKAERIRQKRHEHPRYAQTGHSYLAAAYEMRGDAIASRAARYWHGRV